MTPAQLRIARPVGDLARSQAMYCRGLGLRVLGSFADHDGFDGVMLGLPGAAFHFELTHCRSHPSLPSPGAEELVVFYLPDAAQWRRGCADMLVAGFRAVASFNPYWDRRGKTFEDPDGYRVVLENGEWPTRKAG